MAKKSPFKNDDPDGRSGIVPTWRKFNSGGSDGGTPSARSEGSSGRAKSGGSSGNGYGGDLSDTTESDGGSTERTKTYDKKMNTFSKGGYVAARGSSRDYPKGKK